MCTLFGVYNSSSYLCRIGLREERAAARVSTFAVETSSWWLCADARAFNLPPCVVGGVLQFMAMKEVARAGARALLCVGFFFDALLLLAGKDRELIVAYIIFRPEISRGYPLNLSILLSGGKENNYDSPSNGE